MPAEPPMTPSLPEEPKPWAEKASPSGACGEVKTVRSACLTEQGTEYR